MKIGLDFDGVIADSPNLKSQVANELYGVTVPGSLFKKEIVVRHLTLEQYRAVQKIVYGSEVGLIMAPMPDALSYLQRLRIDGHDLVVVTARTGTNLEIAKRWARIHETSLDFIGVGYEDSKAQATAAMDVYVDDEPKKLSDLIGVPHLFLFSWGYNLDFQDESGRIRRIASWRELYEAIRIIGEGTVLL
jgi:hypothetical protein